MIRCGPFLVHVSCILTFIYAKYAVSLCFEVLEGRALVNVDMRQDSKVTGNIRHIPRSSSTGLTSMDQWRPLPQRELHPQEETPPLP